MLWNEEATVIMKRVIMGGITGHTGRTVARHLALQPDVEVVAAIGKSSVGNDLGEILCHERNGRKVYPDVASAVKEIQADVYVDFTTAEAVEKNAVEALASGLDLIVGTTGLQAPFVEEISRRVDEEGRFAIFASNFSLGIVLLAQGAQLLQKYYGAQNIQIIETHHESKIDIPSGTALYLQRMIQEVEGPPVEIHSLRIPKRTSKHRVFVQINGEIISFEHEVNNPEAFGAGVHYVLEHMSGHKGCFRDLASFVEMQKSRE